jgi:cobalt-zinc-cadmium resistance protein CzcA
LTIEETLALAIKNNASLKATHLQVDEVNALIGNAFNFDKTSVYYTYDENNLAVNNQPLKVFGIAQDFKFPTVYFADKKVNKAKANIEKMHYNMQLQQIKKTVYVNYYQLSYVKNKAKTYQFLDSLYQDFARKAKRKFELGETNYLEMITAKSKQKQLETLYKQTLQEVLFSKEQLKSVVQVDDLDIIDLPLQKLQLQQIETKDNLGFKYFENAKEYQNALYKKEKQSLLPDISLEYFQGTNSQLNTSINGYQFGLKIPLLFSGNASKIKASKIAQEIVAEQQQDYKVKLDAEYNSLLAILNQYREAINYYESQGKKLKNEIIKTANRTFKEGEIDFFQYIQSLETAKDIELSYLDNLNRYNQTIININHLILNIF